MRDILEYPERYSITEDGQVFSKLRGKFLKQVIVSGYPAISTKVGNKTYIRYIHRLLAQAYIPNPHNMPVVNHIDGNKGNYALDNLEWCSYQDNTNHAISTGLHTPARKLSASEVLEIYSSKESYVILAAKFGVGKTTIEAIKNGTKYKDLYDVNLVVKTPHSAAKLTAEDVQVIRTSNESVSSLALKFGVNETSIRKVLKRQSYKYLP